MRRVAIAQWLRRAIAASIVVCGLCAAMVWGGASMRLLNVDSGSMAPLLSKGDAVLIRRVNVLDLRHGDIISYRSLDQPALTITHRVLSVDPITGQVIVQGDANATPDPAFDGAQVMGRVVYAIPKAGGVVDFLRSWLGMSLFAYLPMLIIVLLELRRLARHYLRPTYTLRSYEA